MPGWRNWIRRQAWKLRHPGVPPAPPLLCHEYPQYEIGRATYATNLRVMDFNSGRTLKVGSYCSIAAGVEVMLGGEHKFEYVSTYPFNTLDPAFRNIDAFRSKGDVIIGSDVWIGHGATILSGVTIGHGAVIAARSLVASDVPPYAVVGGNPAKLLKQRFSDEQIAALIEIAWWDWPDDKIMQHVPSLMSGDVDGFIAEHGA